MRGGRLMFGVGRDGEAEGESGAKPTVASAAGGVGRIPHCRRFDGRSWTSPASTVRSPLTSPSETAGVEKEQIVIEKERRRR